MPAMGGAIVLRPGTNFANNSEFIPYFRKLVSVFRTQESGLRDILQSKVSTWRPRVRPIQIPHQIAQETACHRKQKRNHPGKLSACSQRSCQNKNRRSRQRETELLKKNDTKNQAVSVIHDSGENKPSTGQNATALTAKNAKYAKN